MMTLPSPVEPEASSVACDDRLWFDDDERGSSANPQPREPNPENPVSATETELMVAVGMLQDQGLMTESKNLGLQSSTGSETISQGGK